MAGRGAGPDFVEALARGLDVLTCFDADHRTMTLTEVAAAAGLARPTARRLLLTLQELGYARSGPAGFELTPKVLSLGVEIGTRFPAARTSQGKVLLAALPPEELARTLAEPSRAGLPASPRC